MQGSQVLILDRLVTHSNYVQPFQYSGRTWLARGAGKLPPLLRVRRQRPNDRPRRRTAKPGNELPPPHHPSPRKVDMLPRSRLHVNGLPTQTTNQPSPSSPQTPSTPTSIFTRTVVAHKALRQVPHRFGASGLDPRRQPGVLAAMSSTPQPPLVSRSPPRTPENKASSQGSTPRPPGLPCRDP